MCAVRVGVRMRLHLCELHAGWERGQARLVPKQVRDRQLCFGGVFGQLGPVLAHRVVVAQEPATHNKINHRVSGSVRV